MTTRHAKSELRRTVSHRIRGLDPLVRVREEADLGTRLIDLPGLAEAATVLLFVTAFADEVETRPWLRLVLDRGQRLICPRVRSDGQSLELCQVVDLEADLIAGYRSIPEPGPACPIVPPEAIDWALIPGLAFDPMGYRLGRGAGHYDRLLPTLRPETPTFALILQAQWVDAVPREPHDRPLMSVMDSAGRSGPPRGGEISAA